MDTFAATRPTRRLSGLIFSIRRLSVTFESRLDGVDDMIEIVRLRGLSTGLFLAAVVICA
jgi:hypothetical protein